MDILYGLLALMDHGEDIYEVGLDINWTAWRYGPIKKKILFGCYGGNGNGWNRKRRKKIKKRTGSASNDPVWYKISTTFGWWWFGSDIGTNSFIENIKKIWRKIKKTKPLLIFNDNHDYHQYPIIPAITNNDKLGNQRNIQIG